MGVSRETIYPYQELSEDGGIDALINKSRRVPNIKNRVNEANEEAVISFSIEQSAHGQHRTSTELRKKGVFLSGGGVRSIWLRLISRTLKNAPRPSKRKLPMKGLFLRDAQVFALEKKKYDDEACGEIKTAHPGYLGSQDTFYVRNLKGVARIYLQMFVDTYSKIAFA